MCRMQYNSTAITTAGAQETTRDKHSRRVVLSCNTAVVSQDVGSMFTKGGNVHDMLSRAGDTESRPSYFYGAGRRAHAPVGRIDTT